jgi:hypothetical protein
MQGRLLNRGLHLTWSGCVRFSEGILTNCVEDDVVHVRQLFEVLLGVVNGDVGTQALEQFDLLGAGRGAHLRRAVDLLRQLRSTSRAASCQKVQFSTHNSDPAAAIVGV